MCHPTGDYANAHTMYTTYVTVTGNSQQAAVMKVFYDAQKNGIALPDVFQQVHGGTTVSSSQQQGKDSDRGKRVTAGYATLKSRVASLSTPKEEPTATVKTNKKSKVSVTQEQMTQHQQKKIQSKSQSDLNKKLKFLIEKRNNNPQGLSGTETALLKANGF